MLRDRTQGVYVFARWKRCKVGPDDHVEVEGSYYSVPFGLIREPVDVRVAERTVEVFHRGRGVARHAPYRANRNDGDTADQKLF